MISLIHGCNLNCHWAFKKSVWSGLDYFENKVGNFFLVEMSGTQFKSSYFSISKSCAYVKKKTQFLKKSILKIPKSTPKIVWVSAENRVGMHYFVKTVWYFYLLYHGEWKYKEVHTLRVIWSTQILYCWLLSTSHRNNHVCSIIFVQIIHKLLITKSDIVNDMFLRSYNKKVNYRVFRYLSLCLWMGGSTDKFRTCI